MKGDMKATADVDDLHLAELSIIASSVVALGLSYGIPIAINVACGCKKLPERAFALPGWLGWTANIIGLTYTVITSVLFLFPPALPVDGTTMNYCVVAFGVIVLISAFQWVVDGRKNFTGPRNTLGHSSYEGEPQATGGECSRF